MRLGILPRGGAPSAFDRPLGTRMGVQAADLAARGEVHRLVRPQGTRILFVPLFVVRQGPRPVDADFLETARVCSG